MKRIIVLPLQVKVIFEEFYEQGDAERQAGRFPIPMMDRTKLHLQPDSQVGFITGICIPCYSVLNRLIPETQPLLDGCQTNLQRWKELSMENAAMAEESAQSTAPPPPPPPPPVKREQRISLSRSGSLPIKIDFHDLDFD